MTSHQIICELRRDAEKETARRIKAEKVLIDHGWVYCEICETYVEDTDTIKCKYCGYYCLQHNYGNFVTCEDCRINKACQQTFCCEFEEVDGKLLCSDCYDEIIMNKVYSIE